MNFLKVVVIRPPEVVNFAIPGAYLTFWRSSAVNQKDLPFQKTFRGDLSCNEDVATKMLQCSSCTEDYQSVIWNFELFWINSYFLKFHVWVRSHATISVLVHGLEEYIVNIDRESAEATWKLIQFYNGICNIRERLLLRLNDCRDIILKAITIMGVCWDIRISLGSCTLCDVWLFSCTGVRTFSDNIDRNPRTHVMQPRCNRQHITVV